MSFPKRRTRWRRVAFVAFRHTDFLGSPVAETNSAGTVTRVDRYTPYGEPSDMQLDAGPGFTGHATDVATGLTNMQQRYYDAELGRFISPDPVGPEEDFIKHFNRYNYANNNPFRYTDPDGRESFVDKIAKKIIANNMDTVLKAGDPETTSAERKELIDKTASVILKDYTKSELVDMRPTIIEITNDGKKTGVIQIEKSELKKFKQVASSVEKSDKKTSDKISAIIEKGIKDKKIIIIEDKKKKG